MDRKLRTIKTRLTDPGGAIPVLLEGTVLGDAVSDAQRPGRWRWELGAREVSRATGSADWSHLGRYCVDASKT